MPLDDNDKKIIGDLIKDAITPMVSNLEEKITTGDQGVASNFKRQLATSTRELSEKLAKLGKSDDTGDQDNGDDESGDKAKASPAMAQLQAELAELKEQNQKIAAEKARNDLINVVKKSFSNIPNLNPVATEKLAEDLINTWGQENIIQDGGKWFINNPTGTTSLMEKATSDYLQTDIGSIYLKPTAIPDNGSSSKTRETFEEGSLESLLTLGVDDL